MKRLVISSTIAALVAGGAGASFAAGGGPSLNGNNNFGLCTAYLAQQAHRPGGPNQTFQDLANAYQNDSTNNPNGQSFLDYCTSLVQNSGPGNSNGSHTNHGGGHGGS